jgi:predicted nucleic acid-binding protein
MKVFLDTSVLLAASASAKGASRALFQVPKPSNWTLLTSPYVVNEALKNLSKFPPEAAVSWIGLRRQLTIVDDVVSLNRPVIFAASKDRPVLFTALAWADVLLTLDRRDFDDLLGGQFYGLLVRLPFDFLAGQSAAG